MTNVISKTTELAAQTLSHRDKIKSSGKINSQRQNTFRQFFENDRNEDALKLADLMTNTDPLNTDSPLNVKAWVPYGDENVGEMTPNERKE